MKWIPEKKGVIISGSVDDLQKWKRLSGRGGTKTVLLQPSERGVGAGRNACPPPHGKLPRKRGKKEGGPLHFFLSNYKSHQQRGGRGRIRLRFSLSRSDV